MEENQAGPSKLAPRKWLKVIDKTYDLFEKDHKEEFDSDFIKKVKDAVQLCEEVLDELGIKHIALSFNGGKDCTVLVHILAAVLRRKRKLALSSSIKTIEGEEEGDKIGLQCIPSLYITCTSPFQEVEEFVAESIRRYNLLLVRQSGSMKEALEKYLDGDGDTIEDESKTSNSNHQSQHQKRDVKAIFVGTRRSDPHGAELTPRKKTDPGWPEVERIQPILDWTYQDVWKFLRCSIFAIEKDENDGKEWGQTYGIPYCILYDEGYTSLGSTHNTFPNPILDTRKGEPVDEKDRFENRWLPAYRLEDESQERAGRGKPTTESGKSKCN